MPWFTADEAYGDNPGLRAWLDEQDLNYVMAVSCDTRFATPTGLRRADELAASAPQRGWQRLSCGQGSKGHRLYDWLLVDPGADAHLLLVRRSISKPTELAYYICRSSTPVPLAELVRVAGSRWAVEETFQFTKNDTGLDHYQVRRYDAWYRHITLSMLAAAFLAITAHTEQLHDQKGAPQAAPST
jgi:SRSO17 transposase